MDKQLRSYVRELFGTFVLVFFGAMAVCVDQLNGQTGQATLGPVGIALAQGLGLAVGLALVVPHETGYLNPAVTLALWVYKRLEGKQAALLIASQFLGAALAGAVVRLGFAGNDLVLGAARVGTPHVNLRAWDLKTMTVAALPGSLAVEMCLTFILTMVIFATLIDPRAPKLLGPAGRWLSPLWVGLCGAAASLCGSGVTGAALNPARWFGTVIWEPTVDVLRGQAPFADNMVYWAGPIVGALVAGGLYVNMFLAGDRHAPAVEPKP
jgi:glycerol uptake facilitator-like aquaporin